MDSIISQLTTNISTFLETTGYIGVTLLIAFENIFPPIPSEIILPLTGFLVNQGKLWFIGALLAATLGSVIGALFLYYVSYTLGEKRVLRLSEKYGKWIGMDREDVEKGMAWFDKHGSKVVLFGRVIPTIRSVASVPAGIIHMPLKKFILYTGIGSTIWNGILISIGWILGEQWKQVQQYTKVLEYIVLIAIVGTILWIFWRKRQRRNKK